jgi:hypothetical protein
MRDQIKNASLSEPEPADGEDFIAPGGMASAVPFTRDFSAAF